MTYNKSNDPNIRGGLISDIAIMRKVNRNPENSTPGFPSVGNSRNTRLPITPRLKSDTKIERKISGKSTLLQPERIRVGMFASVGFVAMISRVCSPVKPKCTIANRNVAIRIPNPM